MNEIGVGLVGYKFMGRAHSNAYRQVARFFDVNPKPRMVAIAGRNETAVREAAHQLGWEGYETDYSSLVNRSDVNLVDVATPGNNHREVVLAALAAGKHVLCEKPLANTLEEAQEMLTAARRAGVINVVNFNYRCVPAVRLVKQLIDDGTLGEIRHFRAQYLQDWILDPDFPLVWRLRKDVAGTGALGDIGAHILDLGMYLVGPIAEVVSNMQTFIKERPLEVESRGGSGLSAERGQAMGEVTVDDATSFLARFENGAMGTFDCTRLAPGRRNRNTFEINGTRGSVMFDLEKMNDLQLFLVDDREGIQGFRSINVTEPTHPYTGAWWPAGHIIGYEHTFTHAIKDLLEGIASGQNPMPDFEAGFRNQAVLDAVVRSADTRTWEKPQEPILD
ncbi:MAG: Gfo/Idh/MocA family oxidoreductase [Thermomicrobiales bacterium]